MTHFGTRTLAGATALLLASTTLATADISRADPTTRLLFEQVGATGSYGEVSLGFVNPEANSGGVVSDPLASYTLPGFGLLHRYNDNVSVALQFDTPFGAEVSYPAGLPFLGGNATVESRQLSLMGRYEMGNGFSVHAGLRALEVEGTIYTNVQVAPVYDQLVGTSDIGYGYLVGAAYEMPEIALRVALTYFSPVEVDFGSATEQTFNPLTGLPLGGTRPASFSVEFPESINLEFQTGVAPGTLVFGSIHHEKWNGFSLSTATGQYVNFTSDSTTYNLGVGRQFTENWAGSIAYTHRTRGARPSDTALSPTTGLDTLTLGARYTMGDVTISGGVTYGFPGDQTVNSAVGGVDFNDNEVVGLGLRVGFRF